MKILISAQRYHTNQVPIVKGLVEDGHEVEFYVQSVGAVEDHTYVTPKQMKISFIGKIIDNRLKKKYDASTYESERIDRFIPSLWWLIKEVKRDKPDVAILRYRVPSNLVLNLACKLAGVKVRILYNQTGLYTHKDHKNSFLKKLYFKLFPKVRMTTVKIHDVFDLKYHAEDHHILPHDYFLPYVYEPDPDSANRTYFKDGILNVLDVGKYRPYKNHFVLVRAIKVLKDRDALHDIHFTILGQAKVEEELEYLDNLKKLANELDIAEYITFRTQVPYSEMKKVYGENDVFILTSLEEQASITILESMGNAIMPISTNVNGTASYIKEGETGFFFTTDQPETLADTLQHISENRDTVPVWGKNGYEDIKANYMYKNYKAALSDVLQKEFGVTL